jgi:outer membrane lipoprotein SlyB
MTMFSGLKKETRRSIGALTGLTIGLVMMWSLGLGGLVPAFICGAGGAVAGAIAGERWSQSS